MIHLVGRDSIQSPCCNDKLFRLSDTVMTNMSTNRVHNWFCSSTYTHTPGVLCTGLSSTCCLLPADDDFLTGVVPSLLLLFSPSVESLVFSLVDLLVGLSGVTNSSLLKSTTVSECDILEGLVGLARLLSSVLGSTSMSSFCFIRRLDRVGRPGVSASNSSAFS